MNKLNEENKTITIHGRIYDNALLEIWQHNNVTFEYHRESGYYRSYDNQEKIERAGELSDWVRNIDQMFD